jgi:hypothetical protein
VGPIAQTNHPLVKSSTTQSFNIEETYALNASHTFAAHQKQKKMNMKKSVNIFLKQKLSKP